MALFIFALLTLLAPLHHDHDDSGAPGSERISCAGSPSGESPDRLQNECRLCSWSRPSLRPVLATGLHVPDVEAVPLGLHAVFPLESRALAEIPLLRAPPAA